MFAQLLRASPLGSVIGPRAPEPVLRLHAGPGSAGLGGRHKVYRQRWASRASGARRGGAITLPPARGAATHYTSLLASVLALVGIRLVAA